MGAKRSKPKAIAVQNLPAKASRKDAEVAEISKVVGVLGAEERQITAQEEVEEELARLFRTMHLMSERDIDATMTRVFRAMMRMGREPVGSTELSRQAGLNRITVIHHLKRLENAGVVEKRETKYVMRVQSIEEMMDEMRSDMEKQFEEMERMARELDRAFLSDVERFGYGKRITKREEKRE